MKRVITSIFILFLLFGLYSEGAKYTSNDLLDYLQNVPGAELPNEDQPVYVRDGFFAVEDEYIDGKGIDYLVTFIGSKYQSMSYSKPIYIYSENIVTRKIPGDGYFPTVITIANEVKLINTGMTAPAIDEEGNRIEVPIFIAE